MTWNRTALAATLTALVALVAAPSAQALEYVVRITNLSRAQVFSPPVVVSHSGDTALFVVGSPASAELAQLAEDGQTQPLVDLLSASSEVGDIAVADGPIPPGHTAVLIVDADFPFDHISAVGMLVQTNDGFFALDGALLPFRRRQDSYLVPAFDAGSETNSELCAFIPGPPCGSAGVRDTADAEGAVYISGGMHGIGDLSSATYDWRNPVARITIQRLR